jgi:hypothetical protein
MQPEFKHYANQVRSGEKKKKKKKEKSFFLVSLLSAHFSRF